MGDKCLASLCKETGFLDLLELLKLYVVEIEGFRQLRLQQNGESGLKRYLFMEVVPISIRGSHTGEGCLASTDG